MRPPSAACSIFCRRGKPLHVPLCRPFPAGAGRNRPYSQCTGPSLRPLYDLQRHLPHLFLKKGRGRGRIQSELDITLFASRIAPLLHITKRFAGEEPFDRLPEAITRRWCVCCLSMGSPLSGSPGLPPAAPRMRSSAPPRPEAFNGRRRNREAFILCAALYGGIFKEKSGALEKKRQSRKQYAAETAMKLSDVICGVPISAGEQEEAKRRRELRGPSVFRRGANMPDPSDPKYYRAGKVLSHGAGRLS